MSQVRDLLPSSTSSISTEKKEESESSSPKMSINIKTALATSTFGSAIPQSPRWHRDSTARPTSSATIEAALCASATSSQAHYRASSRFSFSSRDILCHRLVLILEKAQEDLNREIAKNANHIARAQQDLDLAYAQSTRQIASARINLRRIRAQNNASARLVTQAQENLDQAHAEGTQNNIIAQQNLARVSQEGAVHIARARSVLADSIANLDVAQAKDNKWQLIMPTQKKLIESRRHLKKFVNQVSASIKECHEEKNCNDSSPSFVKLQNNFYDLNNQRPRVNEDVFFTKAELSNLDKIYNQATFMLTVFYVSSLQQLKVESDLLKKEPHHLTKYLDSHSNVVLLSRYITANLEEFKSMNVEETRHAASVIIVEHIKILVGYGADILTAWSKISTSDQMKRWFNQGTEVLAQLGRCWPEIESFYADRSDEFIKIKKMSSTLRGTLDPLQINKNLNVIILSEKTRDFKMARRNNVPEEAQRCYAELQSAYNSMQIFLDENALSPEQNDICNSYLHKAEAAMMEYHPVSTSALTPTVRM
jgi:hypothetical protein